MTKQTTDKTLVFMPAKSDVIFKLFFGDERNLGFLISFLKSVLKLPLDEYTDIQISDPHLKREYPGDKLAILDVKVKTKTGKWINIEIQVDVPNEMKMRNRIVYYTTKMVTEQVGGSQDYDIIKKVVSIIITGDVLIPRHNMYHDRFLIFSPESREEFTDLFEIHTLELLKLPEETDGTDLYDWLGFIKANSEEELAMLAERSPQMKAPIEKLLELNKDEEAGMFYEAREKERQDIRVRERGAERIGRINEKFDVARRMLNKHKSIDDIMDATDLSREEIEGLIYQEIG